MPQIMTTPDSFHRLLTSLVQKHNVEYVTKPLERRQLWLALTKEYNTARGTTVNHARLSKRYYTTTLILLSEYTCFRILDSTIEQCFSISFTQFLSSDFLTET